MVGLRSLSLSWARVRPAHFVEFLQNVPANEETRLSDVGRGALEAMVPLEGLLGRRGKYEGCTANTLTRCLRGARVIIICKKFAGNVNSSIPGVLKAQLAKQYSDDWSISSYHPVSSNSLDSGLPFLHSMYYLSVRVLESYHVSLLALYYGSSQVMFKSSISW